jgi:hypothetical protein
MNRYVTMNWTQGPAKAALTCGAPTTKALDLSPISTNGKRRQTMRHPWMSQQEREESDRQDERRDKREFRLMIFIAVVVIPLFVALPFIREAWGW